MALGISECGRQRELQQPKVSFAQLYLSALFILGVILAAILLSGCTPAAVDRGAVTATEGAPPSTIAPVASIPRDPNRPTYVVAVEPFVFMPTTGADANVYKVVYEQSGELLAAKMTTTLANTGNISVIDQGLKQKNDGTYKARIRRGEVGPFIIRATVTELTENAEASSDSKGVSLGWLGTVLGIAGAVTGKDGLLWTGVGIAAASPHAGAKESQRKGMVAIDIRIVDGRTSRIVGAFKSTGTFKGASSERSYGLLGVYNDSSDSAQSVVGQALQMALNDAAKQIHETLGRNT